MNAEVGPDPRRWKALAVLSVAYLMVILDVSVTNVALPSIQSALDFSAADLQWVVSGYALTFGGFLLLGGRAGDILGRRRFFMIGLVAFVVFSLLCGLSTASTTLIVARFLQGIAAAILAPSVFSIVSVTFAEGSERNTALGILGAIAGSGAAIGVLLGGVLTEYAGWEWIFFINAPIGLAALLLVPRYVRESRASGMMRHFDAAGAVTVTASLMLLVYALTQSTNLGWGSGQVIGALIGFAVLLAAFVLVESRSQAPLVPLGFFLRRRTPAGANVVGFGLGTAIFGMFYLLSLYMQDVLGYSPVQTGVAYLALALTAIVASGASQALVTRVGVKPVLATGLALLGLGLAYLTRISVGGSYIEDLFPAFIVVGVGIGFSFVPISIAALAGITDSEAGLASGLINTSQQIGGALGLAVLVTVATNHTDGLLASGTPRPAALTDGFSVAFWVAVAFAALALLATLLVIRRRDLAPGDLERSDGPLSTAAGVGAPAARTGGDVVAKETKGRAMRIGIIGAGNIGGTLARAFVRAGHDVAISNSRAPATLDALANELGAQARAMTAAEAAEFGDVVVVSVPFGRYGELPAESFAGTVVIDTTNYYPQRDGHFDELDSDRASSSELLQAHLPRARVVKAFNAIGWAHLRDDGRPAGDPERVGIPISGDDERAKRIVAELIEQIGFDPVDAGTLAAGGRKHQPGSPIYIARLSSGELRARLAA
jgi:EmrB/QacA subfamily drug resistance transporter